MDSPKVTAPERETDQQIASRLAETDWERSARISDKYTGVKSLLSCIRAIAEAQRLAREDEREQLAKTLCSFCREGIEYLDGLHIFDMCECRHGQNYHKPYCHAACRCDVFKKADGKESVVCAARAIRSRQPGGAK